MNARHKLNSAGVLGCLMVAALVGWLAESWTVFSIASAILVVLSFHAGDIRLTGRR